MILTKTVLAQTTGVLFVCHNIWDAVCFVGVFVVFLIKGHTEDFVVVTQEKHLLKKFILHFQRKEKGIKTL